MVVNFLGMKVNVLDHGSFISMGPTQQIDYFLSLKRNQGFGEANGDLSPINIPITSAVDPDVTDANAVKNSLV